MEMCAVSGESDPEALRCLIMEDEFEANRGNTNVATPANTTLVRSKSSAELPAPPEYRWRLPEKPPSRRPAAEGRSVK
jgi:hypothetical protein